jgi:hypothetical protein
MTQCKRRHEGAKVVDVSAGPSALPEEPNLRPSTGPGWVHKAERDWHRVGHQRLRLRQQRRKCRFLMKHPPWQVRPKT